MLEGWTTLGWLAAHTSRARLGLLVGGVHYRAPGLWVKAATTLDVLSGGRAWLGLGAAWNRDESEALGFGFPPLARPLRPPRGHAPARPRDVRGGPRDRGARGRATTARRPRSSTHPNRCRGRASRSSSAAAASNARSGSSRGMPTRATSSVARWRSTTSTRCFGATARWSGGRMTRSSGPRSRTSGWRLPGRPRRDARAGHRPHRRARRCRRPARHRDAQGASGARPARGVRGARPAGAAGALMDTPGGYVHRATMTR